MKRANAKFLVQNYFTNDVDDYTTASVTYVGQSTDKDNWLVLKIDETTGTTVRYGNKKNNTETDYDTAWTNRVDLTYEKFQDMEF